MATSPVKRRSSDLQFEGLDLSKRGKVDAHDCFDEFGASSAELTFLAASPLVADNWFTSFPANNNPSDEMLLPGVTFEFAPSSSSAVSPTPLPIFSPRLPSVTPSLPHTTSSFQNDFYASGDLLASLQPLSQPTYDASATRPFASKESTTTAATAAAKGRARSGARSKTPPLAQQPASGTAASTAPELAVTATAAKATGGKTAKNASSAAARAAASKASAEGSTDSDDAKKDKRERNREAVQNYRKRRKEHVSTLEAQVGELVTTISAQNESLKSLAEENNSLKQKLLRLQEWIASCGSGNHGAHDDGHSSHTGAKLGVMLFVACVLIVAPSSYLPSPLSSPSSPSSSHMVGRSLLAHPVAPSHVSSYVSDGDSIEITTTDSLAADTTDPQAEQNTVPAAGVEHEHHAPFAAPDLVAHPDFSLPPPDTVLAGGETDTNRTSVTSEGASGDSSGGARTPDTGLAPDTVSRPDVLPA